MFINIFRQDEGLTTGNAERAIDIQTLVSFISNCLKCFYRKVKRILAVVS